MMAPVYCTRYYDLRRAVEQAGKAAREGGMLPEDTASWGAALAQLRAHAEVCGDCIGALFEPFVETAGKQRQMVSLLREDK